MPQNTLNSNTMQTSFAQWGIRLVSLMDWSVIDMGVKPKVLSQVTVCARVETVLTLQPFTYQCLWEIHKAIMHTCTVDVQYVRVCVCSAQFNVCSDCVTGPQRIDSTKVTRTVFFALASLFLYFSPITLTFSPLWIITPTARFKVCWKALW